MSEAKSRASKARAGITPYAKILVADEFRMEQNGKVLAIGLYSDGVVVLTIPKNAPKPTKEVPFAFDGIALLLTIGGFEGPSKVRFGLESSRMLEHEVNLTAGNSANLILNLKPFRIGSFGIKNFLVEVANTKHSLPFELRAQYIEAVEDLDQYVTVGPTPHTPAQAKAKATNSAPKKSRAKAPAKPKRSA